MDATLVGCAPFDGGRGGRVVPGSPPSIFLQGKSHALPRARWLHHRSAPGSRACGVVRGDQRGARGSGAGADGPHHLATFPHPGGDEPVDEGGHHLEPAVLKAMVGVNIALTLLVLGKVW